MAVSAAAVTGIYHIRNFKTKGAGQMKKVFLGLLLAAMLLLVGCGTNELENNAFPLAVGISWDDDQKFQIYMAYPDLQSQDAKENAMSTDAFWSGQAEDLFSGADHMSESSSKNVDFNHLKVLILDKNIFADPEAKEALISFFMEQKDAAWNTYVLLADRDLETFFSGDLEISSSLGIYLEDMIEEWSNIKSDARVTVGDLMSQYYNQNETVLVPVLSEVKKRPEISGYASVKRLSPFSVLDKEQAYEAMLLRGQLKAFSFSLEDDTRVVLQQIRVDREISAVSDEKMAEEQLPVIKLRINAAAQLKNRLSLTEKEKQEVKKQAEKELADRLLGLAREQKQAYQIDVTDSFLLLAGYNRSLWQIYGANSDAYEKQLIYQIDTSFTLTD